MKRRAYGEAERAAATGVARDGFCACGAIATERKLTMCHACYERDRRANPVTKPTVEERFFSKVRASEDPNDCWIWVGAKGGNGDYGVFYPGSSRPKTGAHRWVYEYLRAEIPPGLVIDHLCRRPSCVNPWHLEPVTIAVNSLRGEAPMVVVGRVGLCPRGHSMADAALVLSGPQKGRRNCRTCIQLRHAEKASDPEWRARRSRYERERKQRADAARGEVAR